MAIDKNKLGKGGPVSIYYGAIGTALPDFNNVSGLSGIAWTNNEVQTLTPSGSITDGTFTIAYTSPSTGLEEITASLDHDADATAIKAALVALAGIGASDITVTGSLATTVVFTFIGALANTPIPLMVCASSLTGGTAAITRTTPGRLWTATPTPIDADFSDELDLEEIKASFDELPTDALAVKRAIKLSATFKEYDGIAAALCIPRASRTLTPAGSAQVGLETVTFEENELTHYQQCWVFRASAKNPTHYIVHHFADTVSDGKLKPDFKGVRGLTVASIGLAPTSGAAHTMYRMLTVKTA